MNHTVDAAQVLLVFTNAILPPVCIMLALMFAYWFFGIYKREVQSIPVVQDAGWFSQRIFRHYYGLVRVARLLWSWTFASRGSSFALAFTLLFTGVGIRAAAIGVWRWSGALPTDFPWVMVSLGSLLKWVALLCAVRILAPTAYSARYWVFAALLSVLVAVGAAVDVLYP